MKLYYHPNSPNCVDVLATANHLGIELDFQVVDLLKGAQKNSDYLKINPNGRVPTLADGDFILWESNAIMQYLASKKPGNSLWPDDAKTRADISRWQFWQAFHWTRATGTLVWENMVKRFLNAGGPDPAKIKEADDLFHALAAVLNGQLEVRRFLVGAAPTLADFSVAAPLIYAQPARFPLEKYGNVRAWYGRIAELDAWKKALPSHVPG
jgi:glutathione S-transferase